MRRHFDGRSAFVHIEKLAAHCRLPGSDGERLAQTYIRGVGENIWVPMEEEEFRYSSVPLLVVLPVVCLLLGLVSLSGSLAYLWGTSLALIPGVALLLLIYAGFRWSGAFERFAASGGSASSLNLIGKIPGENPRGTIVLSAHYDSKSQVMPVMVRAGLFMVGFFAAIVFGFALLVLGILALAGHDVLGNSVLFFTSLVPAVCLFLLVFNFTGNRSPGAVDNAAGEAIILEAARVLRMEPLENFDVLIASFGCEEIGLVGSINYLLTHEEEFMGKPLYMMNFDIPFSRTGKLFLNTGFELPPKFTSKRINELADRAAREMGLEMKSIYLPVGAAADHMPWVKHGFEATGFVAAQSYIHSAGDTVEKINREALRRVGEIALCVCERLDHEGSSEREESGAEETDLR